MKSKSKLFTKSDIVVIGQNYSTSLALIKAAGEADYSCIEVICSGSIPTKKKFSLSPDQVSKYTKRVIRIPRIDSAQVAKDLVIHLGSDEKKVVLPADDFCAEMLDSNKRLLSHYFLFPQVCDNNHRLSDYLNKGFQKELALHHGIATAMNWSIPIYKGIEPNIPADIIYPCITKPRSSVGMPKSYIQKCDNLEQLRELLRKISANCSCEILVEQYIAVETEFTIPGISDGHKVYIPAFIRKTLIGRGDHRGVTICGRVESANRYDEIRNKLVRLMEEIQFSGNFDIEIFYSNNRFYLNEINFRNGAGGYGLTKAGLNLPAIYIQSLLDALPISLPNCGFEEKTFVNDKAALDYYTAGFCSYMEYRKIKKKEIHFIDDSSDWRSKLSFKLLATKLVFKTLVKN